MELNHCVTLLSGHLLLNTPGLIESSNNQVLVCGVFHPQPRCHYLCGSLGKGFALGLVWMNVCIHNQTFLRDTEKSGTETKDLDCVPRYRETFYLSWKY